MAPNARRFSQITDDSSETSTAGVFANSRSSTCRTQDCTREHKRRRTSGLNARFDNMVRAMNVTYSGPPRQRQMRTRSSSDASHLSSAIADTYSDLHEGRIGETFTLIKMQPLVDSHRLTDPAEQIKIPCNRLQNRTEHIPSLRKALPEWLCSTFSTLAAKHPLRLLLPKKSPCPQTDANDQNSSNDTKTDPTFAFDPDQITQTTPNNQAINLIGSTSNGFHSKNNTQQYRSPSAAGRDDYMLPTLDAVPFSTPGSNIIPLPQRPTTSKMNEVNEQGPNPSKFEDLAFIPFSTPGPASALQSSVVTNPPPPRFDLYPMDCLVDVDTACSPRHLTTSLLAISASHPRSHSRYTSTESSAIDFCLPPYHAAPSDPAPAYSDDIYDSAYYADPLTDESGSEPQGIPQRTDDNLANVFATPGPGYCAPRPIYFDSPTEEPSDPDHSKPGYEIDLNDIDFKWTPFNQKSIEEKKLSPGHERRPESCHNRAPHPENYSEPGVNCNVITRTESPKAPLLPNFLPSRSPFRFTPHQLTTNIASEITTLNHAEPQTLQVTKPAQPFAPAPGIFVSPLREKSETQILALQRTPQNQIIRNELRRTDLDVKAEFPSSQDSHDSIQSWQDVDEDCPQN